MVLRLPPAPPAKLHRASSSTSVLTSEQLRGRHKKPSEVVGHHARGSGGVTSTGGGPLVSGGTDGPLPQVGQVNSSLPLTGRASASQGRARGPVRCLHVEDDVMLQMTLGARLFSRSGLECDVAEDGQAAVDLVKSRGMHEYSIIVIDNQMPRCGGEEATRRLRAIGYRGLVIGMTGDPVGSPDRTAFEAAGLDECTDKTLEGMEVVSTHIDRLIAAATDGPDDSSYDT
eukprot:CAMPEP_0185201416 /NCGR_PEP_ID=MMETSP1140-20130426/49202_1 /TAXON_ID=298111 /ORGANISM="Pavlova sp., Strain CCMP459" /LENGTH=228 /DNA_ID=CAMNT_0027768803 /DNA_START=15 /DNA_END=701 /DNA_ORIENTATION=-